MKSISATRLHWTTISLNTREWITSDHVYALLAVCAFIISPLRVIAGSCVVGFVPTLGSGVRPTLGRYIRDGGGGR